MIRFARVFPSCGTLSSTPALQPLRGSVIQMIIVIVMLVINDNPTNALQVLSWKQLLEVGRKQEEKELEARFTIIIIITGLVRRVHKHYHQL